MTVRPTPEVLVSFDVRAALPVLLPGGQGVTWRAGDVVLKPVASVQEAEWVGSVLSDLPEVGFRVSSPIRSSAGTWTAAGWSAWSWVDGVHDLSDRWSDVLTAGAAFHVALSGVERPSFLDDRDDVWSQGDRAAWDDGRTIVIHDEFDAVLEQLLAYRPPSRLASQLIHGDLTGTVLFDDPAERPSSTLSPTGDLPSSRWQLWLRTSSPGTTQVLRWRAPWHPVRIRDRCWPVRRSTG